MCATSPVAHPASYSLGARVSFSEGETVGAWSSSLTPSNAVIKHEWVYTSIPPPTCFHDVGRKHYTCYIYFMHVSDMSKSQPPPM
jgi:hypothetical protein